MPSVALWLRRLLEDAAFTMRIELPGDVEGLWDTKTSSAVSARRAADSETLKSWAGWNIAAPRRLYDRNTHVGRNLWTSGPCTPETPDFMGSGPDLQFAYKP